MLAEIKHWYNGYCFTIPQDAPERVYNPFSVINFFKYLLLKNYWFESGTPTFVIDSNPSKQGMFLPGTGIPVIAPDDPKVTRVPVILVANPNYISEIRATLAKQGFSPLLMPL